MKESIEDIIQNNPFPKEGMIFRHDQKGREASVVIESDGEHFSVGAQRRVPNSEWRHLLGVNLLMGWKLIS